MSRHGHGQQSSKEDKITAETQEESRSGQVTPQPGSRRTSQPEPEVIQEADDTEQNNENRNEDDRPSSEQGEEKKEDQEEPVPPPDAQEVPPEEFDSRSFLQDMDQLSKHLQGDCYRKVDSDFPAQDLSAMVLSVTGTVNSFKAYAQHSQQQLDGVRRSMTDIREKINKKITTKNYGRESGRPTVGEREMEAQVSALHRVAARAAEDLAYAGQLTLQAETTAAEAALLAEQAVEDARRAQAEYEKRRQAEVEARKEEERRRADEEARREEEERRQKEGRQAEEARRTRLKRQDDRPPLWENWEPTILGVETGDFDGGVGCVVRGDPSWFSGSLVSCELLSQLTTNFTYNDNEELVSNIITLSGDDSDHLQEPIFVAMPHCTSRASAISREPVIKALHEGQWTELKSYEVSFDNHKDLKFVQAEVKNFTSLAVVTRFKQDFLQMPRRGGKIMSSSDARVTFTAERGTFPKMENFVLQLQPVDSLSLADIKRRPEGAGLLTCSSFVTTEWTSSQFESPIIMTLPCPANPVKAKKAAAARAAKEAKLHAKNNPAPLVVQEETKKDRRRRQAAAEAEEEQNQRPKTSRWYMGQYGTNDDDENDHLVVIHQNKDGGRWLLAEDVVITQIKLDLVQLELTQPLFRFIVLRTKVGVEYKEAQSTAGAIFSFLTQRTVHSILKQRSDDTPDVALEIVHISKSEGMIEAMEDEGYDEGPAASSDLTLKEGDLLEIGFRGNVTAVEDIPRPIEIIFNSHLPCGIRLYLQEVDKFLQKSYNVYRGFVQVFKKTVTILPPEPKPEKEKNAKAEKKKENMREKRKQQDQRKDDDDQEKENEAKDHSDEEEDKEKEEEEKEESEEEEEPKPRMEIHHEMLCEHLVSIPKQEHVEIQQTITKAPVILKDSRDAVNQDGLRHLAKHLRSEWTSLAHHLNIKRMRIQAIMRNGINNDQSDEDIRYEMLVTWAKRMPRSVNKVNVLKSALTRVGREDLATELDEMDLSQKQKQTGSDQD